MSLPKSYAEIAARIPVSHCPGTFDDQYSPSRHVIGFVTRDGIVHWKERRVTRSGIRRFLLLAADAVLDPHGFTKSRPTWLQLWVTTGWAREFARDDLHVVLPPSVWAEDKARLAALLVKRPLDAGEIPEARKALRWARR